MPLQAASGHPNQGSTRRYYHFDGLGSTSLLTNTNGDWTDKYSYDGWGNVLQHSTATGSIDQPYQYVGQLGYYTHYMVPGSADFRLLQLGVRFYDPQVGRFTQRDPIRDGLNWYAYVGDRPVVVVDPSGRKGYWEYEGQYLNCMKDCLKDEALGDLDMLAIVATAIVGECFDGNHMVNWVECLRKIGQSITGLATGFATKKGLTLLGQRCLVLWVGVAILKCTAHCYETLLK